MQIQTRRDSESEQVFRRFPRPGEEDVRNFEVLVELGNNILLLVLRAHQLCGAREAQEPRICKLPYFRYS
jgi:hypothetical protein